MGGDQDLWGEGTERSGEPVLQGRSQGWAQWVRLGMAAQWAAKHGGEGSTPPPQLRVRTTLHDPTCLALRATLQCSLLLS